MTPRCYLFLMKSPNDFAYVGAFRHAMEKGLETEYDRWITKDYQIVSGFANSDFESVQSFVTPTLRQRYPQDIFMFLYRHDMAADFNRFITKIAGQQWGNNLVAGYSDIDNGVGYAPAFARGPNVDGVNVPIYALENGKIPLTVVLAIKHELAHLQQCGTWHDAHQVPLNTLIKHSKAGRLPWCMS